MPRSLTSLCASVCSLILIACSSGNIDTAKSSEESDNPVEVETTTEDSSVRSSESAEKDEGDIDTPTKNDNDLANASENIEINGVENDTSSSFGNCSEDDWECSLEAELRTDNVNLLIESLPMLDSQTFSECFIDTFASETGLGGSAIYSLVDFAISNGVSNSNLAPEDFQAFGAALAACNEFLSQGDVQLVTEMLILESTESEVQPDACGKAQELKSTAELITEGEEEYSSVLVGDEEAGIYYFTEESVWESDDPYFETVGEGPSKVLMSDIFCYATTETHGHRVRDTFLTFALNDNFTLFSFGGDSGDSFELIHTDETIIISASTHSGMNPLEITSDDFTEVENLKATNALYLSSLENVGIEGDPESGVYPYPHASNAYVIESDPDAIRQTIFIAWYYDYSESWGRESSVDTRIGGVDLHGGFVERNLEHVIFVQIPIGSAPPTTSHATPIAAAWAADVLARNPNASAEELKQLLLAETLSVDITIEDYYYDEAVGDITDESSSISYSEIMTANILPAR